jgi:tetratricopeptide (TPR) repeat protein
MTFKRTVLVAALVLFCALVSFAQNQSYRDTGIEYYRAGSFDKAANALEAAVAANKKDLFAWVYLGASLLRSGKPDLALKAFRKGQNSSHLKMEGDDKRIEILSKPHPDFPDGASLLMDNVRTVRVAVEFLADGKLGFIAPLEERTDGFTRSSINAAQRIKFNPAWKGGKPVTTVLIVEYSFSVS